MSAYNILSKMRLDLAAKRKTTESLKLAASADQHESEDAEWKGNDFRMLKFLFRNYHEYFARYFFKKRDGSKLKIGRHHGVICDVIDHVILGIPWKGGEPIKRLIINIPPGYTKTEFASIFAIARGLAVNPRAKFIHISYSEKLAFLNSSVARRVVESPEYQELFPMTLRSDANAKSLWYTNKGGGVYAAPSEGQITGFRAGRMEEGFTGMMIIDDPTKPDMVRFKNQMDNINERYNTTFKSRLADEQNPVIVIMQRVADDDFTGYLLKGGSGEKWHHLNMPVLIEEKRPYPKKYTHGIEIEHGLEPGPLWDTKHNLEQIEILKHHPFTYWAQYMQDPRAIEGGVFTKDMFYNNLYDPDLPLSFDWVAIFCDTAQKTAERNDYSVFQAWGYLNNNIYLIDQVRDKWKATPLQEAFRGFVLKHHKPNATYSNLRFAMIEDKSSGTGLIQDTEEDLPVPVLPYEPERDKYTRALDGVPWVTSGRVKYPMPSKRPWMLDFIGEHTAFTADDSHPFDDQIDPHMMAIDEMHRSSGTAGVW